MAIRRRTPIARTKTAGVALVIGAGAVPALGVSPASADSGLAAVQQALGIKADGVMGPQTRKALRKFQRKHGLPAVGLAGPRTKKALGLDGGEDSPTAATGTRRATLRDVQSKLGLDADGVAGPKTRAAIRDFQRENKLDATGRLDPKTRSAIMGSETSAATPRSAPSTDASPAPASGLSTAVDAAREQIGKPYQSAGKGPGGFDCSGLTAFAFKAAGISLGASSFAQYGQGSPVQKSDIQAGDLVFFNSNGSGASHVGIATGPTTMISATSHGVMENSFTSGYWGSHYVGARRVTS